MDPDRDEIMERLLKNVGARLDGYVEEWLGNPEFRAVLHRHDGEKAGNDAGNDNAEPQRLAR